MNKNVYSGSDQEGGSTESIRVNPGGTPETKDSDTYSIRALIGFIGTEGILERIIMEQRQREKDEARKQLATKDYFLHEDYFDRSIRSDRDQEPVYIQMDEDGGHTHVRFNRGRGAFDVVRRSATHARD